MQLYNSLTRKKEPSNPKPDERVNLFVCGPTVYDHSHLGHARTFLIYDAFVKFARSHFGWNFFYVQNITDIDDKIINRSREENTTPSELASRFTEEYYRDVRELGITAVDVYAPATDYIPEIVSQVERLIKKGFAYKVENDGYYFDISKFSSYGKLSGRTAEQAEDAVSRIDESVKKRNRADFALWKFSGPDEPGWETSLSFGRPGWHIEDTAITEKHFGFTYHLHGGALELIFPHHEAEIAQMESLSGISPMVKLWMHAGVLTINGQKMSKSLGNSITIRDFLKNDSPEALRMLVFSAHYRSPLDYTDSALAEANARLERIKEFWRKLQEVINTASPFPSKDFVNGFWKALEDDFNTPKAFATLFDLITETNRFLDSHTLSKNDAQTLLDFFKDVNDIFGIIPIETPVPEDIRTLAEKREQARSDGDFQEADRLRELIIKSGYQIDDTNGGPRIYKP